MQWSVQVMTYYHHTRPTTVKVDKSEYELASMLTQRDPETGQQKVIRYDNRCRTATESRYSQIELESAAVEFTIKKHTYVYSLAEFTVITDNKPLLPLYNSYRTEMPPCIHRHKLKGFTTKNAR